MVVDPVGLAARHRRRRVGGQPDRPDGGAVLRAAGVPVGIGDRRALVGASSAPGEATMAGLRHRRRPDLGRGTRGPRRLRRPCCTCNGWSAASRRTGCPRSSPSPSPPRRRSPRPWVSRSGGRSSCWCSAFSEAAEDARGRGEPDPLPADRGQVYEAAVTIMMRVVFLLFAEERSACCRRANCSPSGYGLSGELDALDRRARRGAQRGPRRHPPHLAPAAGHLPGPLPRSFVRGHPAALLRRLAVRPRPIPVPRCTAANLGRCAIAVSDRVMLEVLRAVQIAELRGEPARRISFRDIDVEQIGYIYEGLLGYTCVDVDEVTVGLIGTAGAEPEITLAELESIAGRYADPTRDRRGDHRSCASVASRPRGRRPRRRWPRRTEARRRSRTPNAPCSPSLATTTLRDRLRPVVGIIRRDLRDRPVVVQPGGLLVVETPSRATAGAHYTPRSLAEEVVQHALEPLVFDPGPHQTADRDRWRRISSDAHPRPQGGRHRLRLRGLPGRRRPLPRRPAGRGLAPRGRGDRRTTRPVV